MAFVLSSANETEKIGKAPMATPVICPLNWVPIKLFCKIDKDCYKHGHADVSCKCRLNRCCCSA